MGSLIVILTIFAVMKLALPFFLFVLTGSLVCDAQVHIGYDHRPQLKDASELTPELLDALKATTTVLFYDPAMEPFLEQMRAALDTMWSVTKLEWKPMGQEDDVVSSTAAAGDRSYFSIQQETRSGENGNMESLWVSLVLWKLDKDGKRTKRMQYAGIELDPSREFIDRVVHGRDSGVITQSDLTTYSPGLLVKYLGCMNDLLLKRKTRGYTSDVARGPALSKLKKDTLYVIESALESYSLYTTRSSGTHDPNELLSDYPFPWKVVSGAQLSAMLLSGERRIFYLLSSKYSGSRFFTVYDSKDGSMLYSDFGGMKYNLKPSDFEDLAKEVLGGK